MSTVAPLATLVKDPGAKVPYSLKWTAWLAEVSASETIASATWTVPSPLVNEGEGLDAAMKVATVIVSGGVVGASYDLVCRITTSSGYIEERTLRLVLHQR